MGISVKHFLLPPLTLDIDSGVIQSVIAFGVQLWVPMCPSFPQDNLDVIPH